MANEKDPSELSYTGRHARVRRLRGKAVGYDCVGCGDQAKEWSQVHDTDGTDPHEHYKPMCFKCHRDYDGTTTMMLLAAQDRVWTQSSSDGVAASNRRRTGEKRPPRSEETRAKISAARAGKPLSEAHKKAVADGIRGIKRSAETRERMRQAALRREERKRNGAAQTFEQ